MRNWRARFLATPLDAGITLACLALVIWAGAPILDWAVLRANWNGEGREACTGSGACWVFVRARLGQFVYGFYPEGERWRVNFAALLLAGLVTALALPMTRRKGLVALLAVLLYPPICLLLLLGGVGGLAYVPTREWGGILVTAVMAIFGGALAFPAGVLLALGRQSSLPVIRTLAVIFIEFWRGVPIISVIFLASNLLPIILPGGENIDRLLRALIGLALVISAYMAEAVRGGLQAIPPGQAEAAQALGLGYWQTQRLIVLPQALRISVPALVNEFIALVKNTTLVLIVSLFDLLGIVHAALADPKWVGLTVEGYAFAGLVFWLACFGLSIWSRRIEARLAREKR
ncbi:MAG: amino acid ABC transporter permease [Alphaproteobacteria bacterium]|nr:amino acid ABC transporter permease [Alphaproteobacteria bacterium]